MIHRLRRWAGDRLRRHPRAYRAWLDLRIRLGLSKPPSLRAQLREALAGLPSVFFVQVGSNDGAQGDPIHRFARDDARWAGIFIEPVGYLFERLRANYAGDKRFVFENVAIAAERGSARFYSVSERAKAALGDRLPYWYDQLGSFDRNHIVKHLDGLLEPYIKELELPCLPLQEVLDRNHAAHIDLLHIDTEGYDWQVLRQFDLARYRPRVVLYEHRHLPPADRSAARERLRQHGYRLSNDASDTLAIRR